jgi:hypothetical protein
MSFNGSTQFLTTPTSANYAFGLGNFTIECWVYCNTINTPVQRIWVNSLINELLPAAMSLSIIDGRAYFNVFGGVTLWPSAGPIINLSTWYHIAVTKSGNTYRLFTNGVLQRTSSSPTNGDNGVSSQFYIGRGFDAYFVGDMVDVQFNGFIDEFRVTKGVARYITAFTPSDAPFPDNL